MAGVAYFIRRCGDDCSIVKLHPDGSEEVFEQGLTLAEVESLYFICVGDPVHEASTTTNLERQPPHRPRPRQLTFKF